MSNPEITAGERGFWRWWPLRLLLFFIVLILLYGGGQTAVLFLPAKMALVPAAVTAIAAALIGAAILIIAYRLLVRWTEHRPATELRASGAAIQLLGGTLIGFVLFAGVYGVLWASGAVTFHGWSNAGGLAGAFAMSLLAGVGEELIFRGAVYRFFENGFGTLIALILSGALFGLIHAANPGATLESSAAIALEAGILLGAAYLLTRSLWLPIGLHFGWNFTEGGIFGTAVSGNKSHGLIDATLSGPQLLSGGVFGPEASVAAVGVCLVAALVMLVLAAQRGHWKPLTFRFRTD
ncbi:MAG TPA: CPBP family intramembrane glutamic endopeptidase [Rhizomicrobium sp.]|nr:CPBP family intramembrane glutamic endopeptidase [Rhizomicrobium sp.]